MILKFLKPDILLVIGLAALIKWLLSKPSEEYREYFSEDFWKDDETE